MAFHRAIFIVLAGLSSIQCGVYLINKLSKTGTCSYQGYVPGGLGPSIKRITSPQAKLQEQQMSMFAFENSKAEEIKDASKKYYDQLTEIFGDINPMVGIGLGILGLGNMIESDVTKSGQTPTHEDVLKSVNKAFEDMTKDINNRFDRMEHYVNHQIMLSEKQLVNVQLESIFKSWQDCLGERTTDGAITCQTNAVRKMRGYRPFFYVGFDMKNIWTFNNRPPLDEVIKMEANFMLFRDYTLINIMMLQTLVNIYREDSTLSYAKTLKEQYINQLSEDATDAVEYSEFVFKWLKDLYTERSKDECKRTLTCDRKQVGDILTGDCSCIFAPNLLERCHAPIHIKTKGGQVGPFARKILPAFVRSNNEALEYIALGYLESGSSYADNFNARLYQISMERDMEIYWQNEILDLIPTWKEIADKKKQSGIAVGKKQSGIAVDKKPVDVHNSVMSALKKFGKREMAPDQATRYFASREYRPVRDYVPRESRLDNVRRFYENPVFDYLRRSRSFYQANDRETRRESMRGYQKRNRYY